MRITISSDGGFTGRGVGSASADVDDAELARLGTETWRDEYSAPGADLIRYTLTFGERSVSWQEGGEIPPELQELFEKVWRARA